MKEYRVFGLRDNDYSESSIMKFDNPQKGDYFKHEEGQYKIITIRESVSPFKPYIEVSLGFWYMPKPYEEYTWESYIEALCAYVINKNTEDDFFIVDFSKKFFMCSVLCNAIVITPFTVYAQSENGSRVVWQDIVKPSEKRKFFDLVSAKIKI